MSKNRRRIIIGVMLMSLMLGGLSTYFVQPSEAGRSEKKGCTIKYTPPAKSGSKLRAEASVLCEPKGNYLPHFKLCIIKERRYWPDKNLGCSGGFFGDPMAGYFQTNYYDKSVRCDGRSKYYTQATWHTIDAKEYRKIMQMAATGNITTAPIIKAITIGARGNNRHNSQYLTLC